MPKIAAVPKPKSSPLLSLDDLRDPERYHTVRLPIFDAHENPDQDAPEGTVERGDVDEPLLRMIARNSNRLTMSGNFPAIKIGHTKRKNTLIMVKGDRKIVSQGHDEHAQSPIVGYASDFEIDDFGGRPCIYADLHIDVNKVADVREFPFRSVERVQPDEVIDVISLLRTPPERRLGVATYEEKAGETDARRRLCYACPCESKSPSNQDVSMQESSVPKKTEDDEDPHAKMAAAISPHLKSIIDEYLKANLQTHIGEALKPYMDMETDPDKVEKYEESEEDVEKEPEMKPEMESDEDSEEETMGDEEMPEEDRETYEMAEPSGSNTFVPGGTEPKPKRRGGSMIHIHQYESRVNELEEMVGFLLKANKDAAYEHRRLKYESSLKDVQAEGYQFDVEELLADLTPDTPAEFEAKELGKIRKHYAKRISGRSMVPTGGPSEENGFSPPKAKGVTRENLQQVIDYATKEQCSFQKARKDLGLV